MSGFEEHLKDIVNRANLADSGVAAIEIEALCQIAYCLHRIAESLQDWREMENS